MNVVVTVETVAVGTKCAIEACTVAGREEKTLRVVCAFFEVELWKGQGVSRRRGESRESTHPELN